MPESVLLKKYIIYDAKTVEVLNIYGLDEMIMIDKTGQLYLAYFKNGRKEKRQKSEKKIIKRYDNVFTLQRALKFIMIRNPNQWNYEANGFINGCWKKLEELQYTLGAVSTCINQQHKKPNNDNQTSGLIIRLEQLIDGLKSVKQIKGLDNWAKFCEESLKSVKEILSTENDTELSLVNQIIRGTKEKTKLKSIQFEINQLITEISLKPTETKKLLQNYQNAIEKYLASPSPLNNSDTNLIIKKIAEQLEMAKYFIGHPNDSVICQVKNLLKKIIENIQKNF